MSNLIVDGYSGIIAPPNLATNGAFTIDQRGNFTFTSWPSGAKPVKVGDYLCDAWKVHPTTTVDYLAASFADTGGLGFHGYGKKGQRIVVQNAGGLPRAGDLWGGYQKHSWTATMQVQLMSGSVPISATAIPWWGTSGSWAQFDHTFMNRAGLYSTIPIIRVDDRGNMAGAFETTNYFDITLQEDGEFNLIVGQFGLFAGAFKNPPQYAPVPYADDLARCQRYYQAGGLHISGRSNKENTSISNYGQYIPLQKMSGIPTVTTQLDLVQTLNGAGGTTDSTSVATSTGSDVTNGSFRFNIGFASDPHATDAVNNGMNSYGAWTAEVV